MRPSSRLVRGSSRAARASVARERGRHISRQGPSWTSSGLSSSTGVNASGFGVPSEDEDRDREVVTGDGGADEGVEDLVEAEDLRRGVGPAAVIAEGAERVEHAAGDDENQSGRGDV